MWQACRTTSVRLTELWKLMLSSMLDCNTLLLCQQLLQRLICTGTMLLLLLM